MGVSGFRALVGVVSKTWPNPRFDTQPACLPCMPWPETGAPTRAVVGIGKSVVAKLPRELALAN